jgi:hypothetical protein
MNLETIIVSACVGVVTSAITAYITTRLKMKEERDKWRREFAFKFAEAQVTGDHVAEKIATQFAIGVLIKNPETPEREKIFVPPNCRLVVGRAPDNSIVIDDPRVSRHHFAFYANDADAFVEELAGGRSPTPIFLNGQRIIGRHRLGTDDLIVAGETKFRFHKLGDS